MTVGTVKSRKLHAPGRPGRRGGVAPVKIPLDDASGTWLAVAYAGSTRIGAWRFDFAIQTRKQNHAFESTLVVANGKQGRFALLDEATVDPARDADLAKEQEAKIRVGEWYERRSPKRVCAVLQDQTAAKLAVELDAMRDKMHGRLEGTSSTYVGSVGGTDVSVNGGMMIIPVRPPTWDTGTTCSGCGDSLTDRRSPEDQIYANKLHQLDARAARFADGCLRKMLGDPGWLPRAPSSGEHGRTFTTP